MDNVKTEHDAWKFLYTRISSDEHSPLTNEEVLYLMKFIPRETIESACFAKKTNFNTCHCSNEK